MSNERTRLAPSPTGALHLGNARTFLVNWALARQCGWRIVLRIEDLDGPRVKRGAAKQAIDILTWLGLDWDEGPAYQLHDLSPYEQALDALRAAGLIYPCRCTRKEIEAAQSAPHEDDHELRYPGTCRPAEATANHVPSEAPDAAWRLIAPDEPITFEDAFAGPQSINVQQATGDFVVATKAGLPAYQLAVVVDDARQNVTQVVRGDDLLTSTPRQRLIYDRLGLTPRPTYTHLPLVRGEDGRRLAKRHGDTRLATYRAKGVSPEQIVGLLAEWCGLGPRRKISAAEFVRRFDLADLPREDATFTPADDAWLKGEPS